MGNVEGRKEFMQRQESQMPLGIGFMGNTADLVLIKRDDWSQMPLGIGFMGNAQHISTPTAARCHKCLSALGSSGEYAMMNYEC